MSVSWGRGGSEKSVFASDVWEREISLEMSNSLFSLEDCLPEIGQQGQRYFLAYIIYHCGDEWSLLSSTHPPKFWAAMALLAGDMETSPRTSKDFLSADLLRYESTRFLGGSAEKKSQAKHHKWNKEMMHHLLGFAWIWRVQNSKFASRLHSQEVWTRLQSL